MLTFKVMTASLNKNKINKSSTNVLYTHMCTYTTTYRHNSASLTLILLMWRIWRAPNSVSKWQTGFNSTFKGLTWSIRKTLQIKMTDLSQLLYQTSMKQQFIVTHTIRQTEVPASWLQTHFLSKCCVHKQLRLFVLPSEHNMVQYLVCCGSVKFFF